MRRRNISIAKENRERRLRCRLFGLEIPHPVYCLNILIINAPGVNDVTGESVAIKLEHVDTGQPVLQPEADYLHHLSSGAGIPQLYWAGEADTYYAMVFELLGPSLEDLFNFCGRRFSLKTVLMLANQILRRIEFVHSKGLIHGDIQPGNLLMGVGRSGNTVYLSDFGIACHVNYNLTTNYATWKRIRGSDPCTLIGNPPFASLMGHVAGGSTPLVLPTTEPL